jgi:DHA2 family multidrug resistance protein
VSQAILLPGLALAKAKPNKWLVTASITFGTLMGAIDSSIVAVGLPHMMGSLGATVQEITWITSGYIIANIVVMPLTAFLGRLFGQKRVYMACLALFLVGSVLCGTARTLTSLLIYRVLQGLGAGALQPTEQAILRQTFSAKEAAMAMALFAMAVMLGPAIGPTLGGYILDNYSWPWIFYINVPIGVLGLAMVAAFVPEDEEIVAKNRELAEKQRKNVDWWGIGMVVVGLCTLQWVLEEGEAKDWFSSTPVTLTLIVSAVTIASFTIRELTCEAPAVNIRLFRDPVFLSATLISSLMFALFMSTTFLLPLFMQTLLGFTATQVGFALMPRVFVMMAAMPIVGRAYNYVPPRLLIGVGAVLVAWGAYDMSQFTINTSQRGIIFALITQGVGFACQFVPLTTVSLSGVPRHLMADATGLASLVRQVGGSLGLAIAATVLNRFRAESRTALVIHVSVTNPAATTRLDQVSSALAARGMDAAHAREAALRVVDGIVSQQATLLAFERLFLGAGLLFVLVLPLLLFLRAPEAGEGEAKTA